MATKAARGTKRTCQNPECEERFYDLNRDPIVCPICHEVYELPTGTGAAAAVAAVVPEVTRAAKPVPVNEDGADGDEVADDDALVSLEDADAELGADDDADDDAFLEDDDEDTDGVSGLIGDVPGEDDET